MSSKPHCDRVDRMVVVSRACQHAVGVLEPQPAYVFGERRSLTFEQAIEVPRADAVALR
jgi:hypothetical protein